MASKENQTGTTVRFAFKIAAVLFLATTETGIAAKTLASALVDQVQQALGPEHEIRIQNIDYRGGFDDASTVSLLSAHQPIGLVSFTVDHKGITKHGAAHVRVWARVLCAKRAIQNAEVLNESNVHFCRSELGPWIQAGYFLSLSDLATRKSKGFVASHAILSQGNTEVPSLVRAGDWVEVIWHRPSLSVRAQARALESGRIPDQIRVELPRKRRVVRAEVSGPGQVIIR